MTKWDIKIHCEEVYSEDYDLIYEQYYRDQDENFEAGIKKGEFGVFVQRTDSPKRGADTETGDELSGNQRPRAERVK